MIDVKYALEYVIMAQKEIKESRKIFRVRERQGSFIKLVLDHL